MKDDIIYKNALTFSQEELAGMYALISKREVEYLKEIEALKDKINSAFNAAYEAGALEQSKGACSHCEDVALMNIKLKKEIRIEGKAKSVAQELIKWHQSNYTKLEKENARLREALEFYASSLNWSPRGDGRTCIKPIDREVIAGNNYGGKLARQALKGSEE